MKFIMLVQLPPPRSMLGLGNYDANVLMSALAMYDYQVIWFDSRLPVERICFENIDALIVNIPSKNYIPFWKGRHWYTVLRRTITDISTSLLNWISLKK
ncbi:hypothetical protein V3C99_017225 [Haemonchus contortus]|uniref:ubiquitinyl hydrolase 1 n=1 Tax=Haemonchus contortus TaxID=6289 RepID=A0A7I5EEP3_HAECO